LKGAAVVDVLPKDATGATELEAIMATAAHLRFNDRGRLGADGILLVVGDMMILLILCVW
jgi:hypothetical protein